MTIRTQALRDRLVADLQPVEPLAGWRPSLALALALAAALASVALGPGVRPDLLELQPHPVAVLRSGMLLLLGVVAGEATIAGASPRISGTGRAWQVALAAGMLFPLAAILRGVADPAGAWQAMATPSGLSCLAVSLSVALALATILTLWLRRGAPASPERSGLLAGLAAGALGGFVFSFRCPENDVAYIGLWYSMAVGISAVAGRIVISRLVRW